MKAPSFLGLLLLSACGGPDDVIVDPQSGTWTLRVLDDGGGDCGDQPPYLGNGDTAEFELGFSSDTVFALAPLATDYAGWNCLAGEGAEGEPLPFSCGTWSRYVDWEVELDELDVVPDATVRFEHDLAGSFTSSTEAVATVGFLASCDGTGCDDAGEILGLSLSCAQEHTATLTFGSTAGAD